VPGDHWSAIIRQASQPSSYACGNPATVERKPASPGSSVSTEPPPQDPTLFSGAQESADSAAQLNVRKSYWIPAGEILGFDFLLNYGGHQSQ